MIRLKAPKPVRAAAKAVEPPVIQHKAAPAAVEAQMFKRKFGMPLQFVEEREWRIVHHAGGKGFVRGPGVPDFYLPYLPGEELFTPWKHYPELKGRRVPPVTVLSHSDIGTF